MREKLSENFYRDEFACKGLHCCGHSAPISDELIMRLERYRAIIGGPLRINSGFRCLIHNRDIGSYDGSQHPRGNAADINADGRDIDDMFRQAVPVFEYVKKYGWGIHVDTRG